MFVYLYNLTLDRIILQSLWCYFIWVSLMYLNYWHVGREKHNFNWKETNNRPAIFCNWSIIITCLYIRKWWILTQFPFLFECIWVQCILNAFWTHLSVTIWWLFFVSIPFFRIHFVQHIRKPLNWALKRP